MSSDLQSASFSKARRVVPRDPAGDPSCVGWPPEGGAPPENVEDATGARVHEREEEPEAEGAAALRAARRPEEGPTLVADDDDESDLLGATIIATPASSVASPLAGGRSVWSELTSEGEADADAAGPASGHGRRGGANSDDRIADDMRAILADLSLASPASASLGDDGEDDPAPASDPTAPPAIHRPSERPRSRPAAPPRAESRGINAMNAALLSGLAFGVFGLGVGLGMSQKQGSGVPAVVVPRDEPSVSTLATGRSGRQMEGDEIHRPPPPPPTPGAPGDAGTVAGGGRAPDRADPPAMWEPTRPRAPRDEVAGESHGGDMARARRQPKSAEEERRLQEKYGGMDLEERAFRILVDLGMVELHPDPAATAWSDGEDEEDGDAEA